MPYPVPKNEIKRLEALRRYQLLDTDAERSFDDFAQLASHICETPIASVTLIDKDRQWFKAKVGLESSETPREHAFCAHTIMGDSMLIVENALEDDRFANNPLVTSDPNIRFYAGAPLTDSDGFALGSLCVIDRKPRRLSEQQQRVLEALARQVTNLCEFRRVSADLKVALAEVKTLSGLLPMCSHCKSIRNDQGYWQSLEQYLSTHSEADLSHGICNDCLQTHYKEVYDQLVKEGKI